MWLTEFLRQIQYELLYSVTIILILAFIKPILISVGLENEIIINIVSIFLLLVIIVFGRIILVPSIRFEFYPKEDIVLFRDLIKLRSRNIRLCIEVNAKSWLSRYFLKLLRLRQQKNKFYQIFWSPRDAITVVGNEIYPSLTEGHGNILINLFEGVKNTYKYSLKVGVGSLPECTELSIEIKRGYKPITSLTHRILFRLIRTKFDKRVVLIQTTQT